MSLKWETVQIPLSAGMNQRGDKRAQQPPILDIAKDVQFEEIGGVQTRKPFAALGINIVGGGTLSNVRRIVENGDELLCFTKDTLYSWNPDLSGWAQIGQQGSYLAVKVDEQSAFVTPGEQTNNDRAELNGTIVQTWTEAGAVYVAARDKTTGALVMASQSMGSAGGVPRVVALSTKILFTYYDSTNLNVCALDPTNPALGLVSPTVLTNTAVDPVYDIVRVEGADQAVFANRQSSHTHYTVGTVTAGLTIATSTKARNNDGPIAVSCDPTGTQVQVIRANGTNIQGDLITISTLVDVYTAQSIGTAASTPVNQIAAAHRSTQVSGFYRCYVFWSANHNSFAGSAWECKTNWVSTGNTLGGQGTFVKRAEPCSRAFAYDGEVYVWLGFGTEVGTGGLELEDSYFLYRRDGSLFAKAVTSTAGGFAANNSSHLPGVALVSGSTSFAWCGTSRRGSFSVAGFAARSPRDVQFTFDSNDARRTARLGETLYVAGGEILQYDGAQLVELGFHTYPYYFQLSSSAAGGSIEVGTYTYKMSFAWQNAKGERDRSASVETEQVTFAGAPPNRAVVDTVSGLYITHKIGSSTVGDCVAEYWRTLKNPTADAPFYLTSSSDPTATSNPNRYVFNNTGADTLATFNDDMADANLATKPTYPDAELEGIAPPPASIITATDTRLFLAGVAGDPDRVWYSKQRNDGQVAAFNEALVAAIPPAGGDITALGWLNETLIVFRERAIYALPGDGFDNVGQGNNYGPARLLSSDLGAVNQESIALTEQGLLFKSSKGWYVLNKGWGLDYVGAAVVSYDSEAPLAAHVVTAQHQVRILTASRMLVWDYLVNQWGEWTVADGLHACVWNGTYMYLSTTGPKTEQSTYSTANYGLDVETAWIKPADLQGSVSVRRFMVLGEWLSTFHLRVRVAYDYQYDGSGNVVYTDDEYWTPSPTVVGSALQVRQGTSHKKCEAIKVRLTASSTNNDGTPPSGGACLKLTGIAFEVGMRPGLHRRLPAAQKQ